MTFEDLVVNAIVDKCFVDSDNFYYYISAYDGNYVYTTMIGTSHSGELISEVDDQLDPKDFLEFELISKEEYLKGIQRHFSSHIKNE